jgi:hypothetical protein
MPWTKATVGVPKGAVGAVSGKAASGEAGLFACVH